MKKIFTTFALLAISFFAFAQADLSIQLAKYSNGQTFAEDTIQTEFIVTNLGTTGYQIGDTVFLNTRINGLVFSLDLLSSNATPYVLNKTFNTGDTLHINPGFIIGSQSLLFFPGATTLEFCMIVWGVGSASVSPSYGGDVNTANNITCATYDPSYTITDLSIQLANYSNGQTFAEDTIKTEFIITNLGETMYHTGDTIYLNSRINGLVFSLDLLSSNPTPYILNKMLHTGDTIHVDPGILLGSQTLLFFPGATTLEFCMIVWGVGSASVSTSYGGDVNTENNVSCVNYDPSFTTGLFARTSELKIYPNPAKDVITFETNLFSTFSSLRIFDVHGRVVEEQLNVPSKSLIDISSWSSGCYFYQLMTNDGKMLSGKFLVNQ